MHQNRASSGVKFRLGNFKTSDSRGKVLFSKNFKTQRISFSMFKIKIYIKKLKRLRAHTARKLKFSIKDFFSKFDLIHVFQHIWSYLLNKWWMETFIFCAMSKNVVGESTQGTVYPISILCLLCFQIYFLISTFELKGGKSDLLKSLRELIAEKTIMNKI